MEEVDDTSCSTIKQTNSDATSGVYTINPDGEGGVSEFEVYCEMDENGGGWIRLRLDNDVDKNGDNMLWFSKYDTVSIQRDVHGSIGQQFDWNQLKQLSDESQLNSDFSDDGTTYYPEMDNYVVNTNRKVNYEMAGGSGLDYTDAQIQAIRQNIGTLSDTTRMFTHTNDDSESSRVALMYNTSADRILSLNDDECVSHTMTEDGFVSENPVDTSVFYAYPSVRDGGLRELREDTKERFGADLDPSPDIEDFGVSRFE